MDILRFIKWLYTNTDTFVWEYWVEMGPPTIEQLRECWAVYKSGW